MAVSIVCGLPEVVGTAVRIDGSTSSSWMAVRIV